MIGIFDSGVGGLTVAREIKKKFPKNPIIYVGDTARVPWGNKSPEIVRGYCEQICDFLVAKKVKKIIIACNTASAFAGDYLRGKYGADMIYDVISPVVQRIASEYSKEDKIGVIGTKGTIASGIYENKIKEMVPGMEVYSKACPLFVPIVEEGMAGSEISKVAIKDCLASLKENGITKLILGCTHYPILKDSIGEYFEGTVNCVGSDEEIVRMLDLNADCDENASDEFYFTDLSKGYLELAKNIYGKDIYAEKISF